MNVTARACPRGRSRERRSQYHPSTRRPGSLKTVCSPAWSGIEEPPGQVALQDEARRLDGTAPGAVRGAAIDEAHGRLGDDAHPWSAQLAEPARLRVAHRARQLGVEP